ncbi:hypothetical protein QNM97_20120 [Gordonia sp. L191]|uniref:hypothetical protein n=1 Tax=Gordonia TaxID=2053 RepID=UPI001AD6749E|nr:MULTISPECIES: hypothetical protein [Gordonia]QTI70171.1 hypothetical protein J6U32_06250 [Gordonia polyisoprenivorans]WHU46281.1 hypothetical protein QNM97_20120 [Gordonia sp. L191]
MSDAHESPDPGAVDDHTAEVAGKVTEALEYIERARGHLYGFHQLVGHADALLGEAVDEMRDAGYTELADRIETEMVGRNVIEGRWTFQIVEEFDDGYHAAFTDTEARVRAELTGGVRHVHEARMKERRRTHGHRDHTAGPGDPGSR